MKVRPARKSSEDRVLDIVIGFMLIFTVLVTLYPFYYVLVLSFNDGRDALKGGIYLWPRVFTLDNYQHLLGDPKWIRSFFVSVARTVIGTATGVLMTSIFAYGLSYKNLLFKKVYMSLVIFSMYFSGGIIPTYILYRSLGLMDSFWVYIVPCLINTFFVLVMISFFREIPDALRESAWLDGANDLYIFWKIILPLSKPSLAAVALFQAVNHWNSWFDATLFIQSAELKTVSFQMMEMINKSMALAMAMAQLGGGSGMAMAQTSITPKALQMACIIVAVAPILLVYPFLQKYFVKGIMLGSVKE